MDKTQKTALPSTRASNLDVRLLPLSKTLPIAPKSSSKSPASTITACEARASQTNPPRPADDYLAQLTVAWEDATKSVEDVGVRHVVCRTAVVLAGDAILMRLMALPVRLYLGGRFGSGEQAMPWIHIDDQIGAIRFLMKNPDAKGPYNLVAPQTTSNAEFMRTLAKVLKRPYWFPYPKFLLRLVLGEMSVMVTEGRFSRPERLFEIGYNIRFSNLEEALRDIFKK